MKAVRLHGYNQMPVIEEVPEPSIQSPLDVIVKIGGAGVCRTDLHIILGQWAEAMSQSLPYTLGHENAGFVSAMGAGVTGLKEGDPVLVYGGWGCTRCDHCVVGEEQLCASPEWVGLSNHDGGYAEYLRVPRARYLVPLTRLEPRVAAPLAGQRPTEGTEP